METLDFFFQSVTEQANDRQEGAIPDLESYIALRRDTSGTFYSPTLYSSIINFLFVFSDVRMQDVFCTNRIL